jgi:hypothetical protein
MLKYALIVMVIAGPAHSMDAQCLAGAAKVAITIGATVVEQTDQVVLLRHPAAEEITYGCPPDPDVFIAWDGVVPPPPTINLIVTVGHLMTGATAARIKKKLASCIATALKPESGEFADFLGTELGCRAFARSGGGGSVEIDTPTRK